MREIHKAFVRPFAEYPAFSTSDAAFLQTRGFAQKGYLIFGQMPPLSAFHTAESEARLGNPLQTEHLEIDKFTHAPDLAVEPLGEGEPQNGLLGTPLQKLNLDRLEGYPIQSGFTRERVEL
ncbi:MAG: hypothetical protein IJG56_02320, partial [Clostridia bacterium]|nr:hypothetical protein [Clostridia bacterium]